MMRCDNIERAELLIEDVISELEEWAQVSDLATVKRTLVAVKKLQDELIAEQDDCNEQAVLVMKFFSKFENERKMSQRLADELKKTVRTETITSVLADYAIHQKVHPVNGN